MTYINIKKLQTLQNTTLHIATGCGKTTPTGHLHAEAQVLPLHDSLSLLSTQFLARALQPIHPSHTLVTSPTGPRNMKNTLQSLLILRVEPYIVDGVVPPISTKKLSPPSTPTPSPGWSAVSQTTLFWWGAPDGRGMLPNEREPVPTRIHQPKASGAWGQSTQWAVQRSKPPLKNNQKYFLWFFEKSPQFLMITRKLKFGEFFYYI